MAQPAAVNLSGYSFVHLLPTDTFCSVINHPIMERTGTGNPMSESAQKMLMQIPNYQEILLLANELEADSIVITTPVKSNN